MRQLWAAGAAIGAMCVSAAALAAGGSPAPVIDLPTLDIFSTTPLAGAGVDINRVPSAVTRVDSKDIERQHSSNVTRALSQSTPSVNVQSVSGNDFQPDVYFRGFDASPVAGTPQGLAVYQNGIRINEAFGDTVNWALIPTVAIRALDVISNNPAFGLNALGGAISMQMKDGFNFQGLTLDVMGGSYGRIQGSLQYGKQVGNWSTYLAVEQVHDNGYRQLGGSDISRLYGDVGYKNENGEYHLNVGAATARFGANGPSPIELLQQNWGNVYTSPQTSLNQLGYINFTGDMKLTPTWSVQVNAHVRSFYQSTTDGNPTNVQPCADPTLLCFNNAVTPANGLNGQQLANTFQPGATLGEIDYSHTQTTSTGFTVQGTNTDRLFGHDNHFVAGLSFDYGVTHFGASAQLAAFQPDFSAAGSGVFLGASGNPVTDGPVSLRTTNAYTGLYALDTFDVTDKLTLSAGGRLNIANIRLQDQIGTALNGGGDYTHFNPMIGATYKLTSEISAYAGWSEANRAPTPLELGCADPLRPCILASFLVSDPALKQVVAQTYEAGLRGSHALGGEGHVGWKLGVYRTDSTNDILSIPDPLQQGFGYFQNVGATRRQGLEAQVNYQWDRFSASASYAYIDATFQNALTLASNSPFADAKGLIYVNAGAQIPAIPHHRVKLSAEYQITPEISIGAQANIVGAQYFAGDASNQFPRLPAYWTADADASWQITKNIQLYAKAENIFDNRYYTYGTLFNTTSVPNYSNGGNPFTDPRSVTPAKPQAIYAGMRATF